MNDLVLSRRDWLRLFAAGVAATSASGWLDTLAAHAAETPRAAGRRKSCILLFMNGGPSHLDTFDPKPGNGSFKAIPTRVPGVQVSEHLPKLAAQMNHLALVRGMSTSEGSHARARYYMHTGYREGVGGVVHPTLGSVVSATLGDPQSDLPNFISVNGGNLGSGYLGPVHAPLKVPEPAKGVENLKPDDGFPTFDRRVGLLESLEKGFLERKQTPAAVAHSTAYQSAVRLMHSARAKAFDLGAEPAAVRAAYGAGRFGEGCLVARRLVEVGVPFVEVDYGGWDTHKDNFDRVKNLSGPLDQALAALLADLKARGRLDSTLIVWMGDFGRTPEVKNGGRGHYPRAWTAALAGGGLKTGQAIGRTDKSGGTVQDRPVSVTDFLATVCKALAIDFTTSFTTREGRPIRVVDKGAKPIAELFS